MQLIFIHGYLQTEATVQGHDGVWVDRISMQATLFYPTFPSDCVPEEQVRSDRSGVDKHRGLFSVGCREKSKPIRGRHRRSRTSNDLFIIHNNYGGNRMVLSIRSVLF